MTNNLQTK